MAHTAFKVLIHNNIDTGNLGFRCGDSVKILSQDGEWWCYCGIDIFFDLDQIFGGSSHTFFFEDIGDGFFGRVSFP